MKPKGKTASTTISFSLATANIEELVSSAKKVIEDWKEMGASVDLRVFEQSDLNQSIIKPRKYDALLFGLVIGKSPDLYPFWHSSQRNDPGLNIAMYTNTKADKALEKMREAKDDLIFKEEYEKFREEIENDVPASFLWSPDFIYAIPEKLKGVELSRITTNNDRFANIQSWYTKTDMVWQYFANKLKR